MIKNLLIAFLIFILLNLSGYTNENYYKVIKVIDGDTFYIDFNKNNIPEKNEKVRLNGIDTFETKMNEHCNWQVKNHNITINQVLAMGYMAKEFAKDELLDKKVKVIFSGEYKQDKYNRMIVSIDYNCRNNICKSYEEEILKQGLAVIYFNSNLASHLKKYQNQNKLKENFKKAKKLDLVYFDDKNNTYHKLNCINALKYSYELVKKPIFHYKKAKCCLK